MVAACTGMAPARGRPLRPKPLRDFAMRALFTLALLLSLPSLASAADWRYCLAPSHAEHKIYVTPPFAAAKEPMDDAESQVARMLTRSGLRYDDVQCPRADDQTAVVDMQEHAVNMNRQLGNQVINLRWKPGS